MELTEDLIQHIEDLEGFNEKAYYDVNGVLTIGFGHTNATKTFAFNEDTVIDREKALAILLADLNAAEKIVNQRLENRNLEVNEPVKNYMVLVEFNRPWVLKNTMEDIATMNADIAKQSQIDAYEKEKGTTPDWYLNRLDKEFAFLNEFDDKSVDGGNGNIEQNWTKYKLIGRELVPEDATAEIWADVLKKLYGVTSPFPDIYKPSTESNLPVEQPLYKKVFSSIGNLINSSIDKQLDFMEDTYGR